MTDEKKEGILEAHHVVEVIIERMENNKKHYQKELLNKNNDPNYVASLNRWIDRLSREISLLIFTSNHIYSLLENKIPDINIPE